MAAERLDRRTMLRGAVLLAGGVLLGGTMDTTTAREARAAATPKVFTRADWGARAPGHAIDVRSTGPTHIVVHHTATANVSDISTSQAAALSRSIQRFHMDSNGWSDIGQQFTISRGGHIMEGREGSLRAVDEGGHVVGAHTANHNSHTIGIENEGTYSSATPPGDLMEALAETCAWLCTAYGLDPQEALVGHRDYNSTNCPGDELYALLPQLRSDTAARMESISDGLGRVVEPELSPDQVPSFPDLPSSERVATHYHGPTVGQDETGG
ncbi:peptidoglycan recognition protein family protein [Nocardiopsis kunsanensis]|uniref:peptidoglycan recognition protein family protein n=1 Tax=Nocardiopsis kunsanensis TaxID=141693 RepID=UPI000346D685|nr:peptidoglycan recognition family protein [Nocardiopsis kunsanensis]